MWIEVLRILQDEQHSDECSSQCNWSLDKINGLLLFLGCIKGYEPSKYAPMFIKWVHQRQLQLSEYGISTQVADSSQSAILYARAATFNTENMQQLKDKGLMNSKDRKRLHHKWITTRHKLRPEDARVMHDLAMQLTAHQLAVVELHRASTAGISVQTVHNMVQADIKCKPPVTVCLYPKPIKYYAACMALQLSPIARHAVIKIGDKNIVNFFRNEAQNWRTSEMGRSQFLKPDLTAKLKLMCMLLVAMRFTEVVFVQVHDNDPWAVKAKKSASIACRLSGNDPWLCEHYIKWPVLASVLQVFCPVNRGQASEQLWRLGAKLDIYQITNEQWADIATKVKPQIHELGMRLLPKIRLAAEKPKDQYAAITNQLYAEFMEAVNMIIGTITGWRLPTNKQPARHTQAFKAVQQHIWEVKQAIKVCKTNKFYVCKQQPVEQAMQLIEDTVGRKGNCMSNEPDADPLPGMSRVCSQGHQWVSKQQQFLKRFEAADSEAARYNTIRWADACGNYRMVKSLTFQQSDNTCSIPLQDMAKYYGDIGKEKPGVAPPSAEEVMEFLGCSPVDTKSHEYRSANDFFDEPYTKDEYLGALKHKAAINPGVLGVPTVCFYMLTAEKNEDIVDIADIDLAFANAFQEHNKLYDPLRLFLCMLLKKANKPSYLEKSTWRNILMGSPLRKTLSTMDGARHARYMQHMNALGYTVVSGRVGFPAAAYAIKQLTIAVQMSAQYKLNLIILLLDMKECFPSMTKRICGWLLQWFGLPEDVVARYLEYNDNNVAVMMEFKAIAMSKQNPVAADFANLSSWVSENTIHFQSLGTTQGCNSSLTLVGMCLRSLTHQWEKAGKGFSWPISDIEMSECIQMPRSTVEGVGYIDDGTALAGGGSSTNRKSVSQTINDMMHIAMICAVWARYFVPMGRGKCKAVGSLFDEEGNKIKINVGFPVYTCDGVEDIPLQPIEDGVQLLGVTIGGDEPYTKDLTKVNEREVLLEVWMQDNNISRQVKSSFYTYSILGLRKYFCGKTAVPSKVIDAETAHFTKKFKAILGVVPSTANAALYANTEDFGCGYPNFLDCQFASDASHTFALANANTGWARGFFNLLLNFTRQQNKINRDDSGESEFFDWDIRNISWTTASKLKFRNEITSLLVTCLRQDLQVKQLHQDKLGFRWTLIPGPESIAKKASPESAGNCIKSILKIYTSNRWAQLLMQCRSQGRLANLRLANRELSNAWRKRGAVSEATKIFNIKATLDILATAVHMCNIYKFWPSAICPLCHKAIGSLCHILSSCEHLTANVYTYRHNLVSDLVETACTKKGWKVISRGVDVPASIVHPTLIRQIQHTRPDLVVVDTNSEGVLKVVIIEVTVAFESDRNITEAQERKGKVYLPLAKAIKQSQSDREVEVEIVVVIVGARGVIPTFWFENMQPLQLSRRASNMLAKQSSVAAIQGSQWIWGLWAAQAHGGETD